tara:strand:- start:717 stop:1181 length:465 start_codon:yes stop_codon:yes gene_type:complete
MFTLGIPKRDYRRATQVLDYESQPSIPYEAELKDDGFYMFEFPGADADTFKKISVKLKGEGIRIVGADEALTEKQIMKLADLVEIESPDENDFISDINMVLEKHRQIFDNPIFRAISDIIKEYETSGDKEEDFYLSENKRKLRKLIRNEFKRIS